MALYAIVAVMYAHERIFLDGSYYFFHVVQNEWFHIEHQRFILAASQALTVAGAWLHLPLNTLLILNSLNPVVYLWTLFLLSVFWLRHASIAWVLLLSSVCGITFIYFIPMYEVWYGCVLLVFFAGMLERKRYITVTGQLFFALVLITLLFSYPLVFVGVIFFTLAHLIDGKKLPAGVWISYVGSFGIWLAWKYFFLSDYETGKIEYPLSQQDSIWKQNFSSIGNLWMALKFFFTTYLIEMIFLLCSAGGLVLKRARLQALLLLGTVAGLLLLIALFHIQPWRHSNYFERMYLLLVPLCFVPFALRLLPKMTLGIVVEFCMVLVMAVQSRSILENSVKYVEHSQMIKELAGKASLAEGSKFFVDFAQHPELSSLDEWSLPMETLIFSSLSSPDSALTVSWKSDIEGLMAAGRLQENVFRLRLDEIYPDTWLNHQYFRLRPGKYKELPL